MKVLFTDQAGKVKKYNTQSWQVIETYLCGFMSIHLWGEYLNKHNLWIIIMFVFLDLTILLFFVLEINWIS